jgi:hypothetical protein
MKGLLVMIGMTIGGWIGWAIGAQVSIFTAFVVSMVGTGFGMYLAIRINQQYLP